MHSRVKRDERRETGFSFAMRLGSSTTCSAIGPVSFLVGVRDLWNLGQVNKEMSTCCRKSGVLKKLMMRNFTCLLKSLGIEKARQFSTLLQSNQCIVSGFFALQCVTGENLCFPSDMDVYCTSSGYKEVLDYFIYHGYVLKDPDQCTTLCTHLSMHHILTMHTVHLLRIRDSLPPKATVRLFDHNFVMALYDGFNFQTWFPSLPDGFNFDTWCTLNILCTLG
jgi:hypothetical protein